MRPRRGQSSYKNCLKFAPDLNQPLYQFINALVIGVDKHVPEWSYTLVINWLEVWADWRSKIQRGIKSGFFTQHFESHEVEVQVHCTDETRLHEVNLI